MLLIFLLIALLHRGEERTGLGQTRLNALFGFNPSIFHALFEGKPFTVQTVFTLTIPASVKSLDRENHDRHAQELDRIKLEVLMEEHEDEFAKLKGEIETVPATSEPKIQAEKFKAEMKFWRDHGQPDKVNFFQRLLNHNR